MKCTEDQTQTVETPGFRILVINPGSTSTKVAVYIGDSPLRVSTIRHKPEELKLFEQVVDQKDFRRQIILDWLKENNIPFYRTDRDGTITIEMDGSKVSITTEK